MARRMQKPAPAENLDGMFDRLAPGEGWETFATRAGVDSRTVLRLRKGELKRPARSSLAKIAAALSVSLDDLKKAVEASRVAAENK